jgi:hypothetical protein
MLMPGPSMMTSMVLMVIFFLRKQYFSYQKTLSKCSFNITIKLNILSFSFFFWETRVGQVSQTLKQLALFLLFLTRNKTSTKNTCVIGKKFPRNHGTIKDQLPLSGNCMVQSHYMGLSAQSL